MKRFIIILLLLVSASSFSQQVKYKVLSNDPPKVPRLSVNLEMFNMDMMQHGIEAASMNYGLWGHYEIAPERIGINYLYRRSWFAFGKLGVKGFAPNSEIELGGYYALTNKIKNKKTKITLKMEYSGTTYTTDYKGDRVGTRTETETYIMIPSDQKKLFMLRAGFLTKSHGNSTDHFGDEYSMADHPDHVKFSNTGLYAGINLRTIRSIFIDSEQYGIQYNSIGKDLYLDLLVLPTPKYKDLDGNKIDDLVSPYINSGPLGFRFGYKIFQVDKRVKTGKTFGMSANFEGGIRPHTGIFLNAGIGLTLIK